MDSVRIKEGTVILSERDKQRMDEIRGLMGMLQIGLLLLSPILLPLLFKKWIWARTVAIGYALYVLWGIYLHFTADITEYGTGYGLFILPYMLILTVVGAATERSYRMRGQ